MLNPSAPSSVAVELRQLTLELAALRLMLARQFAFAQANAPDMLQDCAEAVERKAMALYEPVPPPPEVQPGVKIIYLETEDGPPEAEYGGYTGGEGCDRVPVMIGPLPDDLLPYVVDTYVLRVPGACRATEVRIPRTKPVASTLVWRANAVDAKAFSLDDSRLSTRSGDNTPEAASASINAGTSTARASASPSGDLNAMESTPGLVGTTRMEGAGPAAQQPSPAPLAPPGGPA